MSNGLKGMAAQAPALNEAAAKRQREAQRIQLTQQLAQAPQGMSATRAAQAAAPAVTQAAAGTRLQAGQATANQLGRIAQAGLQQKAVKDQGQLAREQMTQQEQQQTAGLQTQQQIQDAEQQQRSQLTDQELQQQDRLRKMGYDTDSTISFLSQKQREDLAKLGGDIKANLFDSRLSFERDEQGRKFSNMRQLMDWELSNFESQQEHLDKMQDIQLQYDRKAKMLGLLHDNLANQMKRKFGDEWQRERHASVAYMKDLMRKLKSYEQLTATEAANHKMMIEGGSKVVTTAAQYRDTKKDEPKETEPER